MWALLDLPVLMLKAIISVYEMFVFCLKSNTLTLRAIAFVILLIIEVFKKLMSMLKAYIGNLPKAYA